MLSAGQRFRIDSIPKCRGILRRFNTEVQQSAARRALTVALSGREP